MGSSVLVLLVIRTDKEEAKLVERFGEAYQEYMRGTGRFFPRLKAGKW
jgi:protein-S-isoprenylcysteine O-methyltransferase Ste14